MINYWLNETVIGWLTGLVEINIYYRKTSVICSKNVWTTVQTRLVTGIGKSCLCRKPLAVFNPWRLLKATEPFEYKYDQQLSIFCYQDNKTRLDFA